MIPRDQTSTLDVYYSLLYIYGAIKGYVPKTYLYVCFCAANPKSPIL